MQREAAAVAHLLCLTSAGNEAPVPFIACPVSCFAPKVRHKGTSSCTRIMIKPGGDLKPDDLIPSVTLN